MREIIWLDLFLGGNTHTSYGMLRFDLQEKNLLSYWPVFCLVLLSTLCFHLMMPNEAPSVVDGVTGPG